MDKTDSYKGQGKELEDLVIQWTTKKNKCEGFGLRPGGKVA